MSYAFPSGVTLSHADGGTVVLEIDEHAKAAMSYEEARTLWRYVFDTVQPGGFDAHRPGRTTTTYRYVLRRDRVPPTGQWWTSDAFHQQWMGKAIARLCAEYAR